MVNVPSRRNIRQLDISSSTLSRPRASERERGCAFLSFGTMKTSDYFGSFRSASIRMATMVRRGPFATDNWILRTTLVELQIFPFRENFLTVAFDRRYSHLPLPCLCFFFLLVLPSTLPPLRFLQVSRSLEARRFLSTEREGRFVTGRPSSPSLVSSTSRNQLFFESPSMEEPSSEEWIFICRLRKWHRHRPIV